MKDFLDLGNFYEEIKEVIASKAYGDIELPQTFKSQLPAIGDREIVYHKYTAIAYKKNADAIIIPNYWFYLATDILPYNIELHRYYEQVIGMKIFSLERLNQLKNGELSQYEIQKINAYVGSEEDAELIVKFLTDYRWWHGGKELGRGQKDYYVSAVLSLSGLVNDSSTFLASICEAIREKPQLSNILVEFYNKKNGGSISPQKIAPQYIPYITAIKTKPFLLLAGISGTGKSRIVRELARACWDENSEEFKAQKPKNFEMIQVKPNWHDSSELIGYVSRIDGVSYVVGPFLRFMVKAINDPDTPYFLCLDEMNLAPVEQYFAEYLSVIESRKLQDDGSITTDPIIEYSDSAEYVSLIQQLFPDEEEEREKYLSRKNKLRLRIPQNLIVVGTVNMDETTFSFSRKVLDRAMTIEMNEVDLKGGLDCRYENIGKLSNSELVANAVEGVDVYSSHRADCDVAINYLEKINDKLNGTPFKIAYRTRNEVLLYVINNLPYNIDQSGAELPKSYIIARALDEITNMKILPRIEGDETKVSAKFLGEIKTAIQEGLSLISDSPWDEEGEEGYNKSVSLAKISEMEKRLNSGYTSYWS